MFKISLMIIALECIMCVVVHGNTIDFTLSSSTEEVKYPEWFRAENMENVHLQILRNKVIQELTKNMNFGTIVIHLDTNSIRNIIIVGKELKQLGFKLHITASLLTPSRTGNPQIDIDDFDLTKHYAQIGNFYITRENPVDIKKQELEKKAKIEELQKKLKELQ
jgi:hypothetical protein